MSWTFLRRIFDFSASLELAVFLLLSLSIVLATGTVIESKYGLFIAQQMIYQSPWNQGFLWLLLINVTAAAFSRWPWKKHHIGFLITHLGIIVLLLGSFVTQRTGIDGQVVLGVGETSRQIILEENYLNVFKAVPGKNYELVFSKEIPWNALRPFKSKVEYVQNDQSKISINNYYDKAKRELDLIDLGEGQKGFPGIKFSLRGSRANITEFLFLQEQMAAKDLGPAQIRIGKELPHGQKLEKPTIFVKVVNKKLSLFSSDKSNPNQLRSLGALKTGSCVSLRLMDFEFCLDKFSANSQPKASYQKLDAGDLGAGEGVAALEVNLFDQSLWLEVGASGQIASKDAIYYVQFVKRHEDMGFELSLKEFKVGYYPGTQRAMSYSSRVGMAEGEEYTISMNDPLHRNGFTFYQSSYETDETGKPILSVLSVNKDPGRATKYLGSLMIVLGILSMFYFKPMYSGKNKWLMRKQ